MTNDTPLTDLMNTLDNTPEGASAFFTSERALEILGALPDFLVIAKKTEGGLPGQVGVSLMIDFSLFRSDIVGR